MTITFDYINRTITVEVEGVATTYVNANTYLADYPDRIADIAAMGW